MKLLKIVALCLASVCAGPLAAASPAPDGARAYIVSPAHGEVVATRFKVVFGLSGIGVAPAGVDKANTGHHHLLIDTSLPALDRSIPSDANHRHFGGGQTEVILELPRGEHTLQLLLADFAHVPHSPPVASEPITIIVE